MRTIAKIISFVFHPLFLIVYVLGIVFLLNPYLFPVQNPKMVGLFFISTFMLSTFFPIIAISMMRALGLISSFDLRDRRERTGPLMVTSIFYIWLYLNIKDNPGIPGAFSFFVLGATIALFIAFFINIFQKISLHGVGVGGLIVYILIAGSTFSYGYLILELGAIGNYKVQISLLYILVFLITGSVLTSRFLLNAHTKEEVYGGFLVGSSSQLLAYMIFF